MADSFVFYKSFYEALKFLEPATRLKAYDAICEYAINGVMPEGTGAECAVLALVKPQIDANEKRRTTGRENGKKGAEYGKLGGRPPKKTDIKPLKNPKETPNAEKKPANVNVNVNVNEDTANAVSIGPREVALESFDAFWELYPRKEKQDAAARAWISLNPDADLINTIMTALRENVERNGSWKRDGGRYIPKADNWLIERRWRDEVREEKDDEPKGPAKINQFNDYAQRTYSQSDYADLERRKLGRL